MELRLANPARDAAQIADIYAPHVRDGFASFEAEPPDAAEMRGRIERTLRRTPWLVAVDDGSVIGYAYAGSHRERAGYRWSVDVSTYVGTEWQGRGVGSRLYRALFAILRTQGFVNVYAGVALPNEASTRLHRSMGLREVGTYRQVGYKHGRWWDVTWFEGSLSPRVAQPADPVVLPDLLRTDAGRAAVETALAGR